MALKVKKRIPVYRRSDRLAQRVYTREQRQQTARRTFTAIIALLVMIVGAGFVYAWYTGQHQTAAIQNPPVRKTRAAFTPPKISPTAPLGVSVQTVSTPVKPGANASITIRTNPAALCTIVVAQDSRKVSDSGLNKKVADEFGMISWAWSFKASDPLGTWPIDVECKNKKHWAVVESEVVVKS